MNLLNYSKEKLENGGGSMKYHIRFPYVKYGNQRLRRLIVDAGYNYVLGPHDGSYLEIPIEDDDANKEVMRNTRELQYILSEEGIPEKDLDYIIIYDPPSDIDYKRRPA
jgi:hypothetical protein